MGVIENFAPDAEAIVAHYRAARSSPNGRPTTEPATPPCYSISKAQWKAIPVGRIWNG